MEPSRAGEGWPATGVAGGWRGASEGRREHGAGACGCRVRSVGGRSSGTTAGLVWAAEPRTQRETPPPAGPRAAWPHLICKAHGRAGRLQQRRRQPGRARLRPGLRTGSSGRRAAGGRTRGRAGGEAARVVGLGQVQAHLRGSGGGVGRRLLLAILRRHLCERETLLS
jgi:hypothetical protein